MKPAITSLFLVLSIWTYGQKSKFQLVVQSVAMEDCADHLPIDTTLNWYSVMHTDSGDFMISIDPSKYTYEERGMKKGPFELNLTEGQKSLFVFGVSKTLAEGKVSHHDLAHYDYRKPIYPGQQEWVYVKSENPNRKSFQIHGVGCGTAKEHIAVEDYGLVIKSSMPNPVTQNIIDDFFNLGETGMPILEWFGDIDGDFRPDLLFTSGSTKGTHYTLFVSSEAEMLVRKVSTYDHGNCY